MSFREQLLYGSHAYNNSARGKRFICECREVSWEQDYRRPQCNCHRCQPKRRKNHCNCSHCSHRRQHDHGCRCR